MSFEVVEPGGFKPQPAIQEGECRLRTGGDLIARADDLKLVGIEDRAIVLADTDGTLRIALRAVRDGEQGKSVAVSVIPKGKKADSDSGRRRLTVTRAVRRLGLEPRDVKGAYDLNIHNDELLIVNLTQSDREELPIVGQSK